MNRKKKVKTQSTEDASSKKQPQKLTGSDKSKSKVVKSKVKLNEGKALKKNTPSKNAAAATAAAAVAASFARQPSKSNASSRGKALLKVNSKTPTSGLAPKRGRKPKNLQKTAAVEKSKPVQNKSANVNGQLLTKRPIGRPRIRPIGAMSNGKPKPVKKPLNGNSKLSLNGPNTSGIHPSSALPKRTTTAVGPSKKKVKATETSLLSTNKNVTANAKKASQKSKVSLKKTQQTEAMALSSSDSSTDSGDSLSFSSRMHGSVAASQRKKATKSKSKVAGSSTMCNSKSTTSNPAGRRNQASTSRSNKSIPSKKRRRREASLNATAKVKMMCESDRDSSSVHSISLPPSTSTSSHSSKKSTKPTSKSANSKSPTKTTTNKANAKAPKASTSSQPRASKSTNAQRDNAAVAKKKPKSNSSSEDAPKNVSSKKWKKKVKRRRNLLDKNVEIIDTRRCKRMASLNASAMMAATYLPEMRVVARSIEAAAAATPPPEQSAPQPECLDSSSNVAETIDQVVRQWSTVQHIEISPGSSSNCNTEQRKTTVTTTVKHVKVRGRGTVVETISTEYEQHQNIQNSNINSKPEPVKKTVKSRASSKAPRTETESNSTSTSQVTSTASSSSTSAFTPCSGTSPYLGSGSIESIALLSSQAPSTFSTSLSVQKSISAGRNRGAQQLQPKQTIRGKRSSSKKQTTNRDGNEAASNSRSIRYEMKRIETRVESTVNQASVHNSLLAANSAAILANNASSNSLINFNNAGLLSRPEQSPLSYNLYHPPGPFNLLPSAPSLANHSASSADHASQSPAATAALNCINLAPFSAPFLQYQTLQSTFPSLPHAGFTSPISVPFLQFANSAQPFPTNPYDLINQRANQLSVSSLFGLSYLSPNLNSGLYPPSNPVINILPSTPSIIHRPVAAYAASYAQSGQVSSPATNSNMSGLLHNSPVFASSPIYNSGMMPSHVNPAIFPVSIFRPPSIASVPQLNLPVSSYSQPAVYLPPSTVSSSTSTHSSVPEATMASSSAVSQPSSQEYSNSPAVPLSLPITLSVESNTNGESNHDHHSRSETQTSRICQSTETNSNSHSLQQLANMTNNIVLGNEQSNLIDLNNSASLVVVVNSDDNNSETPPKSNRTTKMTEIKGPMVRNGVNGTTSVVKTNGKQTLISSKHSSVAKAKAFPNGVVKRPLENSSSSEQKRPKLSKSGQQNGNRSVVEPNGSSNATNSKPLSPGEKKGATKSQVISLDGVTNGSPLTDAPLLPAGGGASLKKSRRPIVHGWSWEGEPVDRLIFVNNEDQPYLRKCYPAMKHFEGEIIRVRDCVLLKSGPRKTDLPFVAKITALWESPENEMMMSLLWYYRPEHTDIQEKYIPGEVYASRHRDTNSVACIDDKCYVVTYNEFCRFKRQKARIQQCISRKADKSAQLVAPWPADQMLCRANRFPPLIILPELVFCCRKVYDFRQRRILKNPNFKMMICE